VQALAWLVAAAILGLNVALVYQQIGEWMEGSGTWGTVVAVGVSPVALALVGLLGWMTFRPEKMAERAVEVSADEVAAVAARSNAASGGSAWPWTPDPAIRPCSPRPSPWPAPTGPSWC